MSEFGRLVADTTRFTDAVRAGDLAEARKQFAPGRIRWERIEPIAGLVEEIDGKVAARVDDFEGPVELIEEVSEGKITGEEDRYSHTDLWDFAANVDRSRKLFELLTPVLKAKDAALTTEIAAGFAAVNRSLAEYANPGGGFKPYTALPADDKTRMQAGLSERLARIPERRDTAYPPAGTGILGPDGRTDGLAVTLSVGASLFDDRFGLADRRPRELVRMPYLTNDRPDPAQTRGDLLLALSADQPDVLLHALRQLMRRVRDKLVLLGCKDGTANLDIGDKRLMDELIWVGPDDGEPAWAVGGSYQAVRIIRMFVEFWDRTPERAAEDHRPRQGHRGPARPGPRGRRPRLRRRPGRAAGPLDAHIRMANPRTPETAGSRILCRGFNFSRGFDAADIVPVGGGFFFALPGSAPATPGWASSCSTDGSAVRSVG